MAHLRPLDYTEITDQDLRSTIENYEELRGFVPNSIRTMARRPSIVKAFMQLNQAVLYDGTVPEATKMLVSLAVSLATGCRYCQSHMTNLSSIYNVSDEKIAALLNFHESDLFSGAEKAALNLAFKTASTPNEAQESDFDLLKEHYNEGEIVELVATASLFGYLNRWNDTMATQAEVVPSTVTKRVLSDWDEGKHI
jgi:uncharacterized peroxidase-related enzyme